MVKKTSKLKKILEKIDKTSESVLRNTLFKGSKYIDTPGNYREEKNNYNDIFEYYELNMGTKDFDELVLYLINNPKKVNKFMKRN